ncbi:MAG: ATP-dependent Clp protease proteolytic subunit 1 [Chloroflexota bacterium]
MKTWYALSARAEVRQTEISIFDEIGYYGVSAKQFITDLKRVPADHEIVLKIHSPGGEVFDGNAIFNALKRHPGGVTVEIEGLAASMATVISLAGAPVKMAANGFYMIHNPWGVAMGDAEEMRDQAALLEKIREGMIAAYSAKSGQEPEQIAAWMDAETWFTAAEAQAAGFVDEVTDSLALAASTNKFSRLAKFRNAPSDLTARSVDMDPQLEAAAEIDEEVVIEATEEQAAEEQAAEATPSASLAEIIEAAPEAAEEEVQPEEEAPAPEVPVASVPHADAIVAKYNAVLARAEKAESELTAVKAELDAERTALANLERSLGLAAARVVPVIENSSAEASDPVAEYLAAVESGDRKAASALFEKHKAAIWSHRQKLSKA